MAFGRECFEQMPTNKTCPASKHNLHKSPLAKRSIQRVAALGNTVAFPHLAVLPNYFLR